MIDTCLPTKVCLLISGIFLNNLMGTFTKLKNKIPYNHTVNSIVNCKENA